MPRRHAPLNTGISARGEHDHHGRQSVPGAADWLTDRRRRKNVWGRNHFIHRAPNGVYDPFTFWHIIDTLLNIDPSREFNSRQLAIYLNEKVPSFMWDPVTIGKILNDIIESCRMANGSLDASPLLVRRASSGTWYQTNNQMLGNQVLRNLLEDIEVQCHRLAEREGVGEIPRRNESPLVACASLLAVAA